MADFPDSTLLTKFHQALSRRSLMRKGIATAALTIVPAAAEARDPHTLVDHYAKQLAAAMNAIRPGNWEVFVSHELGYSLIVDRGFTKEMEGPLRADDVTGTTDFADWTDVQRGRS